MFGISCKFGIILLSFVRVVFSTDFERDRLSTTRSKVDEITEAQNEAALRVVGLERDYRNIDRVAR